MIHDTNRAAASVRFDMLNGGRELKFYPDRNTLEIFQEHVNCVKSGLKITGLV